MKPCLSCKGTGIHVGWTNPDTNYKYPDSKCNSCNGEGYFNPPDTETILKEIISPRKPNALRSTRPESNRSYYVWRMARFHGGIDMTMPVVASMLTHGDPYTDELDTIADAVAKRMYGSNMKAAQVWGKALGYL